MSSITYLDMQCNGFNSMNSNFRFDHIALAETEILCAKTHTPFSKVGGERRIHNGGT